MIPGLEYEQPHTNGSTNGHSSPSMQSVDISPAQNYGLRRRPPTGNTNTSYNTSHNHSDDDAIYTPSKARVLAKRLDLFPKMERDYEVRTERGGKVTILGYMLIFVLVMAEFWEWRRLNGESLEGIVVDTR